MNRGACSCPRCKARDAEDFASIVAGLDVPAWPEIPESGDVAERILRDYPAAQTPEDFNQWLESLIDRMRSIGDENV